MRGRFSKPLGLLLLFIVVVTSSPCWGKTTVSPGTDPTKKVIRGTLVTPDQVLHGALVIEGDFITCVGSACVEPSGATVYIVTDAFVFPGFIDAHNHVAYNVLPKWSPPKVYQNRGQWQASSSYKEFKKPYSTLKDDKKLYCEMVKYGELKSLISGVTTIQGTSPSRSCYKLLVRNAENQNSLGTPPGLIRTYILDIKGWKDTEKVDFGKTKSFVVHIGEGVDEKSRREFDILKAKGLLAKETAIIHGTAFGEKEFEEMGRVGAKLIWSPQSNLVLYKKTTNVKLALEKGVSVSLGVDWNPSGSDTMLDELRVAERVNEEEFGGAIPESDWIRMVTVNPARALALDKYVGALKPGLKADITVLRARDATQGKSLLNNRLEDVEMVWVGGELLYGDEAVVRAVNKTGCDTLLVHGSRKRICVSSPRAKVEKAEQDLQEIKDALQGAYTGLAPLVP